MQTTIMPEAQKEKYLTKIGPGQCGVAQEHKELYFTAAL